MWFAPRVTEPGDAAPPERVIGPPPAVYSLFANGWGRALIIVTVILALSTLIGLVLLRPAGHKVKVRGATKANISATVTGTENVICQGSLDLTETCHNVVLHIDSGPDRGKRVAVPYGSPLQTLHLHKGDHVRLARLAPSGDAAQLGEPATYTDIDHDRRTPIIWLLILFAILGTIVGRGRGLLALIGTALSVILVVLWLVPSILAGNSPELAALVAALAVMFVTTVLTYGITPQSLAASTGIAAALIFAALLGALWAHLAFLDGTTTSLGEFELQNSVRLPLQGIALAGMVIGALGVITDTAVAQVSTVAALQRTNPGLPARQVLSTALSVGRDHLGASIHTLVMAYAGATLPALLLASVLELSVGQSINDQSLAEPLISTLVGGTAVIAAVPLTTALATLLISHLPATALAAGTGHEHHH